MKTLYFNCFSGISGDMTIGALLDLGIDKELFINELNKLNLEGYEITIEKKVKSGIAVTDFDVVLNKHEHEHQQNHQHQHEHKHEHKHEHEHQQNHKHQHQHQHENDVIDKHENHHQHAVHHHDSRNLADINELIEKSQLKDKVKALSKKIFMEIAMAEAKVHNKGINEVHFHEVGAIDSIVDIVGASICIDILGVEKVFCSAMHDGHGFIKCQHGLMPVPVPAVMEMLQGSNIPLITEDINTELITPTGMAIIKSLAEDYGTMPNLTVERVGYGAGKRETGGLNALRVVLGNLIQDDNYNSDEVVVLETNIDDSTPEILGYTMEKLLECGARDAFYIPIYMKKNRPGVLLTAIADIQTEQKLVDIILKETSTIGIRRSVHQRYCMRREIVMVKTEFGKVKIKVVFNENTKKAAPEYEDCKRLATETGKPLSEIYQLALKAYEACK